MSASPPRILVIGDLMQDIAVRAAGPLVVGSDRTAKISFHLGGSAANQAIWMARFGLAVDFVARVGRNDAASLAEKMAAQGVRAHLVADAEAETGRLIVIVDPSGERSFLTDRSANERLAAEDIAPELIARADFIQFSGYSAVCQTTRAMMRATVARASATPFGFDPASAGFIREFGPEVFLQASAGAAAIFPNVDEAEALTGAADPKRQIEILARHFPLVVLKRGRLGAMAAQGGEVFEAAAPPVDVVDSTGAGDAFVAAFLAKHLSGAPLRASLEAAVEAGAEAVGMLGAGPRPAANT